ncbi:MULTISPECIES: DUF6379 domain-containing protein [unclassified Arthrobacter]|uniref:C-glycoside deglycosidase beta subunit domain-containing protein n=1 Tax=unclassified Arthrobacter TaxID=235627 RepID=UPI001C85473E|nr:DUF6379 domain-containing protein [Arthrobacter sp. MAHUQ-56]MBX7445927.1 hypothetical protein [Arthrobacter sp. MAHUQ-56]
MFDRYVLVPNSLHNEIIDGQVVGFSVKVRAGYYRGFRLALLEDLQLTVDGLTFERKDLALEVGGKPARPLDDLETEYEQTWDFGAPATLHVRKPGGLEPGAHSVIAYERIRVSYFPLPAEYTLADVQVVA